MATGMSIHNQLNIHGNKHTSNATNVFWMQQAHQLSQQRLHSRQRNFIMAIGMHYCNQLNIRGNKHISIATLNRYYRNAQLVVAIATHKGNHHFGAAQCSSPLLAPLNALHLWKSSRSTRRN
jgi:hypothetical protein